MASMTASYFFRLLIEAIRLYQVSSVYYYYCFPHFIVYVESQLAVARLSRGVFNRPTHLFCSKLELSGEICGIIYTLGFVNLGYRAQRLPRGSMNHCNSFLQSTSTSMQETEGCSRGSRSKKSNLNGHAYHTAINSGKTFTHTTVGSRSHTT